MAMGAPTAPSRTTVPCRPDCGHRWTDAFLDVPLERDGCTASSGVADVTVCEYATEQPGRFVVLMGDSHATMYMPALRPIAAEKGWRLVTLLKAACMPVIGVHNTTQGQIDGGASCRQWRRNALAWLAGNQPDVIILAYSDNYELVDAQGRLIAARRRPQVWADGMRRTLAALPDRSQVLVVGDVPSNAGNPVLCLRQPPRQPVGLPAPARGARGPARRGRHPCRRQGQGRAVRHHPRSRLLLRSLPARAGRDPHVARRQPPDADVRGAAHPVHPGDARGDHRGLRLASAAAPVSRRMTAGAWRWWLLGEPPGPGRDRGPCHLRRFSHSSAGGLHAPGGRAPTATATGCGTPSSWHGASRTHGRADSDGDGLIDAAEDADGGWPGRPR